jgi:hypothetical protein
MKKVSYSTTINSWGPIALDRDRFRARVVGKDCYIHSYNPDIIFKWATSAWSPLGQVQQKSTISNSSNMLFKTSERMIILPYANLKEYLNQLNSKDNVIVDMTLEILANKYTVIYYNIEV